MHTTCSREFRSSDGTQGPTIEPSRTSSSVEGALVVLCELPPPSRAPMNRCTMVSACSADVGRLRSGGPTCTSKRDAPVTSQSSGPCQLTLRWAMDKSARSARKRVDRLPRASAGERGEAARVGVGLSASSRCDGSTAVVLLGVDGGCSEALASCAAMIRAARASAGTSRESCSGIDSCCALGVPPDDDGSETIRKLSGRVGPKIARKESVQSGRAQSVPRKASTCHGVSTLSYRSLSAIGHAISTHYAMER